MTKNKPYNMKVTVIVVDRLGTVAKDFEKRLEELKIRGRIETIQITTLWKSARILRGVLEA